MTLNATSETTVDMIARRMISLCTTTTFDDSRHGGDTLSISLPTTLNAHDSRGSTIQ